MRCLTAPKIICFYVHQRLLFLPSSTSALLAVFLAGLTFGFNLVLFLLLLLFLLFIFVIFSLFFLYFCCYYLFILFGLMLWFYYFLFRGYSNRCKLTLLDIRSRLVDLCVCSSSGPSVPHLQVLRFFIIILVSPVPVSIVFRDFTLIFFTLTSLF